MEVHFTGIHSGGKSVGMVGSENQMTKKIYADNAIPGEEALVTVLRRQRGFRQGVVHQILTPSPHRVTPFCPHAGICGGCHWQHIAYPAQLYWKRQILADALAKYGIHTSAIPEVIPSPLLHHYRNKSEYAFSSEPAPVFGFHPKEERRTVFACEHCFLQAPQVHQIAKNVCRVALELGIPFYRYADRTGVLQSLQVRTTTLGDTFCILGLTKTESCFLDRLQQEIPMVNGWFYYVSGPNTFYPDYIYAGGARYLEETIDGIRFAFSPESFFQPNPLQTAALYRQVKTYSGLDRGKTVYDLYTGIGSIACYLANDAGQVIGIEGNPVAIRDANKNAALNGLSNTQFIAGDILETFTPAFIDHHPKADLIILDPPRSGTLTEIKKALLYAAPQKIIYVSCNPVSLAWDLKQLCAGGYRVTAIQPFDMFPHTHHVETVCLLETVS